MITALRARNFRFLWAGQFVSQFGNVFLEVAALWILQLRSPTYLAIAGVVMTAPMILAAFGGALVDQLGPRRLMILTDVVRAVGVGLMAALVAFQPAGTPAYLIIALGLTSLGGALFSPAEAVIIPDVLPDAGLASGNGLMQMTSSTANTVGYAVGGAFLVSMGSLAILGFDAITYAVSALSILLVTLKTSRTAAAGAPSAFSVASLRNGFSAISQLRWFMAVVPVVVALNAILNGAVLMLPFWVHHLLRGSAAVYGILIALWTAGQVLGSLMAGAFSRFGAQRLITVTTIIQGLFFAGFALWRSPAPEGAMLFLASMTNGIQNAHLFAIFQRKIPEEVRGRAFGVLMSLLTLANPLGVLMVGATLTVLPLEWPWFLGAALMFVLALQFGTSNDLRGEAFTTPSSPDVT